MYLLKAEKKLVIPVSTLLFDVVQFKVPSRVFSQLEVNMWQLMRVE